jgi:hypothetical protein
MYARGVHSYSSAGRREWGWVGKEYVGREEKKDGVYRKVVTGIYGRWDWSLMLPGNGCLFDVSFIPRYHIASSLMLLILRSLQAYCNLLCSEGSHCYVSNCPRNWHHIALLALTPLLPPWTLPSLKPPYNWSHVTIVQPLPPPLGTFYPP